MPIEKELLSCVPREPLPPSPHLGPDDGVNSTYNAARTFEGLPLRIAVIGCGHVGLVTGICLASIGHYVTCVDCDTERMRLLEEGRLPLYEAHLDELFLRSRCAHALAFARDSGKAARDAEVVFLCVGVPQLENGDSDFSALDTAARQIAQAVDTSKLIVVRSTVPVQTGEQLMHLLSA